MPQRITRLVTPIPEAKWIETQAPIQTITLSFTELASGKQGRLYWVVLHASNGKFYRVFGVISGPTFVPSKREEYEV